MLPEKLLPGGKADVQHTHEGLEITVTLPRNIPVIAFLSFWLCGWAMGEVFATGALISMIIKAKSLAEIGPGFFLIFWLCGWTLGGYFAITTVLRSALGSDVININSSQISINEKIGSWGKPKLYDVPSIKNLRMLENPIPYTPVTPRTGGVQTGPVLAFDYKGSTVQFIKGLTLEELEAIIDVIWKNNYLERENFAKSVIAEKEAGDKEIAENDRQEEFPENAVSGEVKPSGESKGDDIYFADI